MPLDVEVHMQQTLLYAEQGRAAEVQQRMSSKALRLYPGDLTTKMAGKHGLLAHRAGRHSRKLQQCNAPELRAHDFCLKTLQL